MKLPEPPPLCVSNGEISNWYEFERWCLNNSVAWNHGFRMTGRGQWDRDTMFKWLAYHHTARVCKLENKVSRLSALLTEAQVAQFLASDFTEPTP